MTPEQVQALAAKGTQNFRDSMDRADDAFPSAPPEKQTHSENQ